MLNIAFRTVTLWGKKKENQATRCIFIIYFCAANACKPSDWKHLALLCHGFCGAGVWAQLGPPRAAVCPWPGWAVPGGSAVGGAPPFVCRAQGWSHQMGPKCDSSPGTGLWGPDPGSPPLAAGPPASAGAVSTGRLVSGRWRRRGRRSTS